MSNIVERLTENIVSRDLAKEGAAIVKKWEKTGLLEGLSDDNRSRDNMALMLENQAKELLREASTMAAGDVQGFAAVAFPIVRRVFGGLLANELVSVQPMSLPSGLIFFLDFNYTDAKMGVTATAGSENSLYGGGVLGAQLTGGVQNLTEDSGGFYNLHNGYASPTGSSDGLTFVVGTGINSGGQRVVSALTEAEKKVLRWDPDVLAETAAAVREYTVDIGAASNINTDNLISFHMVSSDSGTCSIVRRLSTSSTAGDGSITVTFYTLDTDGTNTSDAGSSKSATWAVSDAFLAGAGIAPAGGLTGADPWGLENVGSQGVNGRTGQNTDIPEIDIQVDSVSVTAITKKLKAKWSPELGQDLNAYHNLDAEVELTSILSEQIALEIDREILNDLVQGAAAGTYYWSRSPGLFVKKDTGVELGATAAAPDFTGTVSEWYETLLETVNDLSAQIHRKTVRGGANFIVTSPEVASILEMTSGFRASVAVDEDKGTAGAVNVGQVSKKWDVYVDPYFPRNILLVGRKGNSFLESGYVYAPYVPLQVTPTIFGIEDFVPRKGVMTRYAKKMVRPDMYGLVVVRGLLGESGS